MIIGTLNPKINHLHPTHQHILVILGNHALATAMNKKRINSEIKSLKRIKEISDKLHKEKMSYSLQLQINNLSKKLINV